MADKTHDPEKIVQSEAFRAINLLIDLHANEAQHWEELIRADMSRLVHDTTDRHLTVRVSDEPGDQKRKIRFAAHELKSLAEKIGYLKTNQEMIGQLQRYKLRLLADSDFTHGDTEEQRAVFGEPS